MDDDAVGKHTAEALAAMSSTAPRLNLHEQDDLYQQELKCTRHGNLTACEAWQRLLHKVCPEQPDGADAQHDSPSSAWACHDLAQLYSLGIGEFNEPQRAAKLYQRACSNKHFRACYNLAMMYVLCACTNCWCHGSHVGTTRH